MTNRTLAYGVGASLLLLGTFLLEGEARACGCLAPPDPASPVVQAAERILFSAKNGQVTAHIQIQYAGQAADFGWLLPLPSVPTLEIGSEELFAALEARTRPTYRQEIVYPQNCNWPPQGFPGDLGSNSSPSDFGQAGGDPSPVVLESSIGPYDYAVLKADNQVAMLDWLAKSRYFVPAGTDAIIKPYIHAGAYFLALKLKSGQSAGDIAPVVVHYASDLPMIPLILTSVTSAAILDVITWVVGDGRAIPRNYHHAVLDDAMINWSNINYQTGVPFGYLDQVRAAVTEAPGHHAFLTEMAQPLSAIDPPLISPQLLGAPDVLRRTTDAGQYLQTLRSLGLTFSPAVVSSLAKHIKQPPDLKDIRGTRPSPTNYFYNFDFWFSRYPQYFVGFDLGYDPIALTNEIDAIAIKPLRDAAGLFEGGRWLTRLYTRIAATEMNSDPVFSFNKSLPAVSNDHKSVRTLRCGQLYNFVGRLKTESGFEIDDLNLPLPKLPAAERIEILRETGQPEVLTDNRARIIALIGPLPKDAVGGTDGRGVGDGFGGSGCAVVASPVSGHLGVALAAGLLLVLGGVARAARGSRRPRRRGADSSAADR